MVTSRSARRFTIDKVWAKNYRSIADASLELDPITVLVGPNASGKSNVLDALRFVKDALRFDLEAAVSLRHGFDVILRRTSGMRPDVMEIGITATVHRFPRYPYSFRVDYSFTLAAESSGDYRVQQEFATVSSIEAGQQDPVEFRVENGRLTSPASWAQYTGSGTRFRQDEDDEMVLDDTDLSLRRVVRTWRLGGGVLRSEESENSIVTMARALDTMLTRISQTRYYHIFPNTIREPQRLDSPYPLYEDASNMASVLRNMEREHVGVFARLKESLALLVPGVSNLEVTSAGGYLVVRLKHEDVQNGGWLDLAQESDGTIRLLGLLTGLYHQGRPLPLIGIEEPELTVHPGALTALADVLKEASRRYQLIVTTHSPELIDRITDFRDVDPVRIVELVGGATQISPVSGAQKESVAQHLFSPGELHRMGVLERSSGAK